MTILYDDLSPESGVLQAPSQQPPGIGIASDGMVQLGRINGESSVQQLGRINGPSSTVGVGMADDFSAGSAGQASPDVQAQIAALPPTDTSGLGMAPQDSGGIGLAPPAAPRVQDTLQSRIAAMSPVQKILSAFGEFGAGVQGRPSPLTEQMKAERDARMGNLEELKGSIAALKQGVDMMDGLTGEERTQFAASYGKRLDAISPGLGETFKQLSNKPGMLEAISKNTQYLPGYFQDLIKSNPKEALRIAGTPEGQKMLMTATEIPVMNKAVEKGQFLIARRQAVLQQVAPELFSELSGKTTLDAGDFIRINNAVAADPKYKPLALTPYELQVAQSDHHGDAFYSALHVLSPKNAQEALKADAMEGKKPLTDAAKAEADFKAGRITTDQRDAIIGKTGVDQWGDPYPMNGAMVQKNAKTGEIRQAVSRVPATIINLQNGSNDALSDEDKKFMAKQYLAGDKSVLQNLGRGTQGSKNIVALRGAIREEAKAAGMTPEMVAVKIAEFEGLKAGERTAGTREAQLGFAAHELENFIPLAETASEKVTRTGFVPLNRLIQAGESQWSPEQAAFVAANRAVINSFAMVASRGVQTVHNVGEAEKMLNTAGSHEIYKTTLKQLQFEVAAALKAPKQVRADLADRGGASTAAPTKAGDFSHLWGGN